jgi:hypothetical protein
MKNQRLGTILLVTLSTLLTPSCKKKNEELHPEETAGIPVKSAISGTFTAKINGAVKTFGANFYMVSGGVGTVITGSETGGTSITLGFFSTTAGTYDVDGTLTQAYYYVGSTQHVATSGKIIITEVENDKISGAFYFKEMGGVSITEGIFTDVPKNKSAAL